MCVCVCLFLQAAIWFRAWAHPLFTRFSYHSHWNLSIALAQVQVKLRAIFQILFHYSHTTTSYSCAHIRCMKARKKSNNYRDKLQINCCIKRMFNQIYIVTLINGNIHNRLFFVQSISMKMHRIRFYSGEHVSNSILLEKCSTKTWFKSWNQKWFLLLFDGISFCLWFCGVNARHRLIHVFAYNSQFVYYFMELIWNHRYFYSIDSEWANEKAKTN